nr:LysE family translocator [Acidovorax sp.]
MEQFLMVAGAHFLALLSPGPDFFLIVRTALLHGWRRASGICVGVALGNGLFIGLAWAGLSAIQPGSPAFTILQWAGSLYLAWLGWQLLRSPGTSITVDGSTHGAPRPGWGQGLRMGLASALLNPKNALFYASLFSLLAGTPRSLQALYGVWMVSVVLGWDLLVAAAAGHRAVVERFARHLRSIERVTGATLLLIAVGVATQALANR